MLATLVAASPAHAQTMVPQPSITAPKWILSVGIQESLASRALLSAASDQGDLISRPGASVTHNWLGSRFRLGVSARGSALLYKTLSNLNHFNYIGGVAGAYQASPQTNDTLGVHIVGPHATDLIAEASLGFELEATPWEIGGATHAHPTLSEVIGEAAMAVDGQSLNF
jgi:hypothetical protein